MMCRLEYLLVRENDTDSVATGDAGNSFLCDVVLRVFADKSALLEVEGDVCHAARISLFVYLFVGIIDLSWEKYREDPQSCWELREVSQP